MKRIKNLLTILVCMLIPIHMYAQTVLIPEDGKAYNIVHSSGYYLANGGSNAQIMLPSYGSDQQFKFILVADSVNVYNIQQVSTGSYLIKSGSYNTAWGTDPSIKAARFRVVAANETQVKFQCLDNSKFLGTDNNTVNAGVYSDKSGADGKHYWTITVLSDEVKKDNLKARLDEANGYLSFAPTEADVVDASYYPSTAKAEYISLIDSAQVVYDNGSATQDEVTNMAVGLGNGTTTFLASYVYIDAKISENMIVRFQSNVDPTYYLIDNNNAHDVSLVDKASVNDRDIWVISPRSGGGFDIKNQLTGLLLKIWGANNVYVGSGSENRSQFNIYSEKGNALSLQGYGNDGKYYFFRINNDTKKLEASAVHDRYSLWNVEQLTEIPIFKSTLETALKEAKSFIAGTVVGNNAHQYSQEAYDVFNVAIEAAQTVFDSGAATQEEVDNVTAALKNALTAYKAIEVKPTFNPEAGVKYRVYNNRIGTYLSINGTTPINENFVSQKEGQYWEIVESNGTYIFKNDTQALTQSLSLTAFDASASDQQWTVHNDSTIEGIDYYAFQKGVAGDALQFKNDGTLAVVGNNNTSSDQWFAIIKVDSPNDPNKIALNAYIATATNTLDSGTIGTVEGTFPQSAYDAFKVVITQAGNMVNGQGYTQDEVDGMLATLKDAEKTFIASKITLTGIDLNSIKSVNIYTNGNSVQVDNLEVDSVVTIYSVNGQLIYSGIGKGTTFSYNLSAGSYIVTVQKLNNKKSAIIIIR